MDQRLIDAAQAGDIEALYGLLQDDHFLLENIDKVPFSQTPLHVAILARQTNFAKEIASLKPSFASKLDPDGFSPMHLAASTGQVEMVKELLTISPILRILKGREKRTPLHCAAMAGSIDVISLLLDPYPQCLIDLTIHNETAFHLAVKNNQLGAFKILLEWLEYFYELEVDACALQLSRRDSSLEGIRGLLERTKLLDKKEFTATIYSFAFENSEVQDYKMIQEFLKQIKKEEVLNWKDDEGNTVLHRAAIRKQRQMIEALLSNRSTESGTKVEVNTMNENNLTALDIILLHLPKEKEFDQMEDILRKAGAVTACQIITLSPASAATITNIHKGKLQLKGRPLTRDLRNGILLFATLMATVCFLIVVNPPGGVWQDSGNFNYIDNSTAASNATIASHQVGTAILGERPYLFYPFMIFNAAGFIWSLVIIYVHTMGSPFKVLIQITLAVILGNYVFSMIAIMPVEYLPFFLPIFLYILVVILTYCAKVAWICHKNRRASAAKEDQDHQEKTV